MEEKPCPREPFCEGRIAKGIYKILLTGGRDAGLALLHDSQDRGGP